MQNDCDLYNKLTLVIPSKVNSSCKHLIQEEIVLVRLGRKCLETKEYNTYKLCHKSKSITMLLD